MGGIRSRVTGGQWTETEINEEKPLTILCHKGDVQIEVNDKIEINYDITRYHGNRVFKIDPIAQAWAEHILGFEIEKDLQPSDRPNSVAHVIGLCDLPIKLMQQAGHGLPIFFREPETSLHPSQQSNIADFMVAMSNKTEPNGSFTELPPEK